METSSEMNKRSALLLSPRWRIWLDRWGRSGIELRSRHKARLNKWVLHWLNLRKGLRKEIWSDQLGCQFRWLSLSCKSENLRLRSCIYWVSCHSKEICITSYWSLIKAVFLPPTLHSFIQIQEFIILKDSVQISSSFIRHCFNSNFRTRRHFFFRI